ncbi:hypothetical protein LTR98_002693 [Exophiala xenobiotica]|nr:hypothetical protein LTR98_002693 [Exophiala xenobiotica]KAK5543280.1 hypothetical protein LTR23_004757 [Chaetothyriales sp. CCFEE 6169]
MENWTADEARDLLGQYGGDIINDFAEPQWNETEDTMGSGYVYVDTLNTVCHEVSGHLALKVLTQFEDNNDISTESAFLTGPFFQSSFDNSWPRPNYQQADLARRIMAANGSAAGGSDRPEDGQAPSVGQGSIKIEAYPDPSFLRAHNAGTRQSSYGSTGVSTGNPDTMGHQNGQNALRHTIERNEPLPKTTGYGAPIPHAAGLGMRPTAPSTVETGTYMSVGFPPIPGYSEPTGDLPFGDMSIGPKIEKTSGHAGANTNGGQYPGASLDQIAGNAARAVAGGPDAGAHDNMVGNNAATVAVGAGASVDTGGASHASGQDNMPARRGRGRPRGSKRKEPSSGQQDNRPAARARTGTRTLTTPADSPVASAEQQDNNPAARARMTPIGPPVVSTEQQDNNPAARMTPTGPPVASDEHPDNKPAARAAPARMTPTGPPVASAEQQDMRPAAVAARNLAARAARMTSPNPPVTLPDGNVSHTASLGPPTHGRKTWAVFEMYDPFCCHICFHVFQDEQPLREHYWAKHREQEGILTKRDLYESYHYAKCTNMKTLGWYKYQGIDTTYTGGDPKMMELRRIMRVIFRPTDPDYLKEVYKDQPMTSTEAKKAKEKEAADKEATNKE